MTSETRRLLALLPLQAGTLLIGLSMLDRAGTVHEILGGTIVAGALMTIAGLLIGIRGRLRRQHD